MMASPYEKYRNYSFIRMPYFGTVLNPYFSGFLSHTSLDSLVFGCP
ncbi:MAG: hypothetical protein JETT_3965 [Candidatus Jettenia ecosi]|uniref:Uncharacterized protein n=1 Tax=Candidatus Jettenia ecosi TaxID=2494326 RepID=A0A533Q5H3_9BACT|nr:MAG: hypothetical protein JETT_3965 [Candidatus Jettenia ecosi]